jgi:hypothetical protein
MAARLSKCRSFGRCQVVGARPLPTSAADGCNIGQFIAGIKVRQCL